MRNKKKWPSNKKKKSLIVGAMKFLKIFTVEFSPKLITILLRVFFFFFYRSLKKKSPKNKRQMRIARCVAETTRR